MGILSETVAVAPQVPLLATEQNFASIHSRFKINFLLQDGTGFVYYGQEANASIEDMMAGTVAEVKLNAWQGYQDCMQQERDYRPQYATAVMYRRKGGRWHPVAWWAKSQLIDLAPLRFEKHITRYQVVLKENLLSLHQPEVLAA